MHIYSHTQNKAIFINYCWNPEDVYVKYDFPVKLAQTSDQNMMIVGDSQVLKNIKTESISKLSNFNFQWTKILYQNNIKHIAFFFTFFRG